MEEANITRIATELIYLEGRYLDQRDWSAWLDLYCEDAVYWVPAWRDENALIEDPDREVSIIYHDARRALEERVSRVQSKKTVTAMPLPRTAHFITSAVATLGSTPDFVSVNSVWSVLSYNPRTAVQQQLFGHYLHHLVRKGNHWRIALKKIVLLNDRIPTMLDFYSV
jgi:3-phenylpropionate/cinnamic acid dioxygenase small subunit